MLSPSRRFSRILKVVLPFSALCFLLSSYPRDLLSFWTYTPNSDVTTGKLVPGSELPLEKVGHGDGSRHLQKTLDRHTFREDGLLEVNPDGSHPIFELIVRSEQRWEDKFKHASTTLREAVKEYRRRYGRAPPKGFDDWSVDNKIDSRFLLIDDLVVRWEYVIANDVQLPDEYDQIHRDLEPFWGIEPSELLDTQSELERKKDSYTIGKTSTSGVAVVQTSFEDGRYNQLIVGSVKVIALLQEIEEFLPPFRAVFSPHDGPNLLSDYAVETATREAAAEKRRKLCS